MNGPDPRTRGRRRLLRRGPCENATIGVIALGMFMLMQPFSLALYSYSFVTILAGTAGFMVASKLAD
jgi:hypothetical protein